jgi:hypothetical protein
MVDTSGLQWAEREMQILVRPQIAGSLWLTAVMADPHQLTAHGSTHQCPPMSTVSSNILSCGGYITPFLGDRRHDRGHFRTITGI